MSTDPATLAALHARCFPPDERWDARAMASLLATPGCLALADESGLVLLRVAADEAEILTLGVVPEQRRQGHARALLMAALQAARQAGAVRMFIDVADANAPAIGLYEASGYVEVGRRRRYYSNGADALVMCLGLSP